MDKYEKWKPASSSGILKTILSWLFIVIWKEKITNF